MAQRPTIGMPTLSPRAKRVLYVLAALVILAIAWFQFVGFYWSWAWFGEVGKRQVFTTEIWTRVILFVIGFIIPAGLVFGSLVMAYRSRPVFVPTNEVDPLAPYRTVISTRPRLIAIGIAVLVGAVTGVSAQAQWQTVQLWMNSQPFGQVDPQFGYDIGFYIFELPLYRTLITWALIVIGVCFAAVLVVQYLYGGLRVSGPGRRITPQAALQLSLLVGLFVLVKAVAYWFDRYDLLFSDRGGIVTGAGYTDINAVLPAKIILMIIAAICAIGFFVGAFLRSVKLPAIAVALLVLSSVLIGGIWPLIMQQVVVNPNTISREPEFVQRNMDGTREAFGLTEVEDGGTVQYQEYDDRSTATPTSLIGNPSVANVRLLDPNVLAPTFTQLQQSQNFYGFADQLTIDRYEVDGQKQDFVLGVREMDANRLREDQRTWINEHMVFTHGNGLVAAPANTVVDGYPAFTVSDVQGQGDIPLDQPRVYYGQLTSEYAIVGQESEANAIEYDTNSSRYTYTGAGGVGAGSFFDRLIFATRYGEANFLFSTEINENSKILYNRDPAERVQLAAPFLTLDTKPYPAAVDGRLVWIIDGYTTAKNYPYAQAVNLAAATANSQTAQNRTQAQIDAQVSYIRNSVKATVDAYDGTVTLYEVDDQDPVLKAWKGVFPDLIQSGDTISDDLRAHFRYPQDLFEVQRSLLTKYHLESPIDLINNANLWKVPDDPTEAAGAVGIQPPYYQQIQLPDQDATSFQLTSALTGFDRPFLSAYLAAESDPENYGKLSVLRLQTEAQTPGPGNIQQNFNNNQEIAAFVTVRQNNNTRVVYGNLLTLPTTQGLLYVEPIYLQGNTSNANAVPQLGQVLIWFNKRVGMGEDLPAALRAAARSAPVDPVDPSDPTVDPSNPPSTDQGGVPTDESTEPTVQLPAGEEEAFAALEAANTEMDAARTSGDLVRIAEATDALQQAVENYLQIAMPTEAGAPSAEGSPEPTEGG